MSFYDLWQRHTWDDVASRIRSVTGNDVERVLAAERRDQDSLAVLLSPAARPHLEKMARRSVALTRQRFGNVISLFAPLYLSNACTNNCLYCSFRTDNPTARKTLTVDEVESEGRHLYEQGFRHVLLVSGEAPAAVSGAYLRAVVKRLQPIFASISIEIYPLDTGGYRQLADGGVDGLVVYQETYDDGTYRELHRKGRKSDFAWRLETPERGGEAGLRRIGIGALLGLSDWRAEGFFVGLHARYLLRHYWKSHVTVSFPRLRPAALGFEPPCPVDDPALVQLLTALRLTLPDAGLILSTRETPRLRDHLLGLGITSMSAGSRTDPGGYAGGEDAQSQFEIADHRSAEEMAAVIRQKGFEPVWKDWDRAFIGS